jgi:hypothetical protein
MKSIVIVLLLTAVFGFNKDEEIKNILSMV